jgi:hypothetical protein
VVPSLRLAWCDETAAWNKDIGHLGDAAVLYASREASSYHGHYDPQAY